MNCPELLTSVIKYFIPVFFLVFAFSTEAASVCGYKVEVEIKIERERSLVKSFHAGVAETAGEHRTGLMNCALLEKDSGLFFLFESSQIRSFWMKETSIPLTIIYFDMNMKINSIEYGKPFSMIPVYSKIPTAFVLEINSYDSLNLKVGDQALLRYY